MSDTLPVLSTDALTVAVTSLLKRPLPDNDQIPIIKDGRTVQKEKEEKMAPRKQIKQHVNLLDQEEAEKMKLTSAESKEINKSKQSNNGKSKQTGKSKKSCKSYQNEDFSKSRKCYVKIPPMPVFSEVTGTATDLRKGKKNVRQNNLSKAVSARKESSTKTTKTNKRKQNDTNGHQKPVEKYSPVPEVSDSHPNKFHSSGSTLRELLTLTKANELKRNGTESQNRKTLSIENTEEIIRCAPETLSQLAKSFAETSQNFAENHALGAQSVVMESAKLPGTSPCDKVSLARGASTPAVSRSLTAISLNNSSKVSTTSVPPTLTSVQGSNTQSSAQPMEVEATRGKDHLSGQHNFSFSTPWVPQQLTNGVVPMLSLGPGLNIPLTIRPQSSQLVSALLSRLPAILPKPNQSTPVHNPLQNQPASENHQTDSSQSHYQFVSIATTVHSKSHTSVQYVSLGKTMNTRIEDQQAHPISRVMSDHPILQLQLNQPVSMATLNKPMHEPPGQQPVLTISPAKSSGVPPHLQSVSIATVNPINNSHQPIVTMATNQLPVTMARRSEPSLTIQQHQQATPTTVPQSGSSTDHPAPAHDSSTHLPTPAQYMNDTMHPPSSQNNQQGDPTGMEIQSLMNIVYGHLMERDRVGATPTPSTLMLESSLRNLAVPYQTAQQPTMVTSQPSAVAPEGHPAVQKDLAPNDVYPSVSSHQTPSEAVALESQSFESHQNHLIVQEHQRNNSYQSAQAANHNETNSYQSAQLVNHTEVNGYQSAQLTNQSEDNGYQPAQTANHNETNGYQSAQLANQSEDNGYQPAQAANHNGTGLVHQTGLSLIQPNAPAQFIQSNTTPETMMNQSYLGAHHQEPAQYSHHSVISHTEHLRHPPPVENYQYNDQSETQSACMYRQHHMGQANGQIGNQRLVHQTANQSVERYTTHDPPVPPQYYTAEVNGHVKGLKAQKTKKPHPADAQPDQIDTEVNTEELPDTESSELDTFYCITCNRNLKTPCQTHNTDYVHIEDSPVLSRARASLPKCFYLGKTETMVYNSLGVWCAEELQLGTRFGPILGPCREEVRGETDKEYLHFNPYKVFERDKATCYDMSNEDQCNWMMFIQLATSLRNQNCVLYQQGKQLYCVTKKIVKKDTELLMWFSSDLCLRLKVSQDPFICTLEQCLTCGLQFLSKKLLRSHRKSKHPTETTDTFTCYLCGKTYSSRTKLNSHTLIHMGVKPHRCVYCNKEFADYSNLKVHQFIHTGQKKYQCQKCGRTFRQKAHLNSHAVIHTGEKNWKCKYCEKCFARQSDCKTHEYNHTQERMYTCEVCRKVFYKLQSFKRHQKVHTGERNYMCNKCFKGFHTKYHRDRHLKICKEKSEKESTYMSLEEVANLDNTCDAVPLAEKEYYEKTM